MMIDLPKKLAEFLLKNPQRIHLIGVAGSGMSGIAGLLLALGHRVSGCDRVSTLETRRLETLGLKFYLPQTEETVRGAELIVYSSAIRIGNPAFDEAVRLGLPMVRRAEALAALMQIKKGIVIAGMHGKTTTSAMTAHVLRVGGLNPSHYVGAEIPILGTNAHWEPNGGYLVAEGDESDGTLRIYHSEHAIILNIEEEHLDYYSNLAAIDEVFNSFLDQVTGKVVYCADDPHATRLCSARLNSVSYGKTERAFYRYRNFEGGPSGSHFEVWRADQCLGRLALGVPGAHNVSNALGVVALAIEIGVSFQKIVEALESFRGARRRFEIRLQTADYTVVDDYGHHPTEIKATLETARSLKCKRVIVMFQPHRYSRTKAFEKEFGASFDLADQVYVTDIYAASEAPIAGVSGDTIVAALKAHDHGAAVYVPKRSILHRVIGRIAEPGDLILSLGAGDIHEEGTKLVRDLEISLQLREVMGAGEVRLYEPLSKHTTLRVGGPAQFWIEPETRGGLANVLEFCAVGRLPVLLMGRGSNLLVREGGVAGVVIHLNRGDFVELKVKGSEIHVGAGVRLKQVAAAARNARIGGFEWMEGIPGSVGGSLRMNAGAMGSETFEKVVSVQVVSSRGEFETLRPSEMQVQYRNVPTLRDRYAVSAVFRGEEASFDAIDRRLMESSHKRKTTQPIASSAGCIFKNPRESPAGKLVEELGLKNRRVGAARVSEVHGNFIVNDGGARSEEILQLIAEIQLIAKEQRGIELQTEVQIVGVDNE
ncbi:MAG TPA: UDP-N-acetylmuramate--L-alanine ligase [Chthoniobacterales bacterium]|jgi:UDP-N-acetylmuramate--alanine ligase|nr:UDP-N-acetylmuramate--L-alanine ligase [Chthoniobacterales bacterium]